MYSCKVSVVIPAYNQAAYVGDAIKSVLAQSFADWQLLVVDDGSTDDTAAVVAGFTDPRVRCIRQPNQGLPAARNTGIEHATGEYLAFLDADDFYHPDKLRTQVNHLDGAPDVGLSYTSRIEIDQAGNPLWLSTAPAQAGLPDLLVEFPFTINDLLVRSRWVEEAGRFDRAFSLHGEDRDFYLRLALAGCRCAGLNKPLAYRRVHARRNFRKIPDRLAIMQYALDKAFADPRCPADALAVRDLAYANIYVYWACQEFAQTETANGLDHLQEAVRLNPDLSKRQGAALLRYLISFCIRDGGEHEDLLRLIMGQVGAYVPARSVWAVARGYLMRGIRDVTWGRVERGTELCRRAAELGLRVDTEFLRELADQLGEIEMQRGVAVYQAVLKDLAGCLRMVGTDADVSWLQTCLSINQAFRHYRTQEYRKVLVEGLRAVRANPRYITNRGVISITVRSAIKAINPLSRIHRAT